MEEKVDYLTVIYMIILVFSSTSLIITINVEELMTIGITAMAVLITASASLSLRLFAIKIGITPAPKFVKYNKDFPTDVAILLGGLSLITIIFVVLVF